ncbi:MAG: DUF4297 domain-containing protein [Simkania sp.]|nr:DUF4297 domain-containing protein [Simkania sp.]
MTKPLFEEIIEKPQREVSGSDSALRFDYQKDWAFCRMLELHIAGEEYLVAFEFHDDVVFLDSEGIPRNIDFFQVKTQKSPTPRKLSTLTSKKKNGNSILGKLCQNIIGICKDYSIKLFLVSNHPYEFSSTNVCANSLDEKYRKKITETIKEEFPELNSNFIDSLYFYVSDIPLNNTQTYLQGQSLELFKKRFGENASYNVFSWIRLIQGEIKRKNNFPSAQITTVEELKAKKCLGKSFINTSLDSIEKRHKNVPDMQIVNSELSQHGWSAIDLMRLGKAYPNAVADYQDPSNNECLKISQEIEALLTKYNLNEVGVSKVLGKVYSDLQTSFKIPSPYKDKMYITALILLIYNEKL